MDAINKNLSETDKKLDELEEGSPQFLVRTYTVFQCLIFTFSLLYILSYSLEPLEVKPNILALLIQFGAYERILARSHEFFLNWHQKCTVVIINIHCIKAVFISNYTLPFTQTTMFNVKGVACGDKPPENYHLTWKFLSDLLRRFSIF